MFFPFCIARLLIGHWLFVFSGPEENTLVHRHLIRMTADAEFAKGGLNL